MGMPGVGGGSIAGGHEGVDRHRAEDALVDEVHPELAVPWRLDVQADAEQARLLHPRLAEQDLAAHPEVGDDRAARRALQRDPEELAAPGRRLHDAARQQRFERPGERVVPLQRAGLEHLDAEDRRSADGGREARADDLNLGKLWHVGSSARSRR